MTKTNITEYLRQKYSLDIKNMNQRQIEDLIERLKKSKEES